MLVAVTDYTFPDLSVEHGILSPLGHEIVSSKARPSSDELRALVAEADAVITQFAPVTAEVVASMQRARVIVRYGIGVDNVDLDAARSRGIPVCNVPDYCVDEVADHTLAYLLAVARQVVPNCLHVRGGRWGLATPLEGMTTLRDLTVGLVGFGRIGRAVAARLGAFRCRVLVHDPVVPAADVERQGCRPVPLRDLLAESDIVSLHCPSTPQTRGMVGREALAAMKRGVILVNVARGDLVDPEALTDALREGHVGAAALDVFAPEPIPADHPILRMDNVLVAAHVASASVPAVRKLRETVADLAARALRGDPITNVVNGVPAG